MLRKLKSVKLNRKGFTLAELLIVIAIIAILVAIAIPTFTSALNKAHKAVDDANIRAAFAEHQVAVLMGDEVEAEGFDATAYVTGKYGELQYYASVDGAKNPWVGVPKA